VDYAVCERVLRQGSFAADVVLTGAAGINGLGVDADAVDEIGVDEARRILDGEGVRASSYMSLDDILSAAGDVARRLDVAAALEAPVAVVMTGPLGALRVDEADARCREWLACAAPLAADRGMRVALEPTHPLLRRWSYVHTFEHARALVDDFEAAGIVFDLGHLWWERDVDALVRAHVAKIATVQLTNIDAAALAAFRYERAPFEAGDVPVASLVALLEASGYRGWYENEALVRLPRDQRLDALRRSHEWFGEL
jgi:sugar phosphate isomerase/epimerase